MKQLYLLLILIVFVFTLIIPRRSVAQPCSCPGGDPIDSVVHTVQLDSVTLFFTNVAFPKFDPAIGSLSCLSAAANVTTISTLRIANRESFSVDYELDYSRNSILNGFGFSSVKTVTRHYGPYSLGPVGSPDTVVYVGPDTVFNNSIQTATSTDVVPYMGATGTINISYGNTYGYTWWQGSNNSGLDVATYSRVNLRLVYYWCPNIVLPSGIRNFSAVKNDHLVQLQWLAENDHPGNIYQIEISRDGASFRTVAQKPSTGPGTQRYLFDYDAGTETGRIFFRIRQVDERGKAAYSAIRPVSFQENGVLNPAVYPNPASGSVYIQFESTQNGSLQIELTNTMGQLLEQSRVPANQLSGLQLHFNKQYAKGMYWLRIRNQATGEQSVTRLNIQ